MNTVSKNHVNRDEEQHRIELKVKVLMKQEKKKFSLFERPFKIRKDGVFSFASLIPEIFKILYDAKWLQITKLHEYLGRIQDLVKGVGINVCLRQTILGGSRDMPPKKILKSRSSER